MVKWTPKLCSRCWAPWNGIGPICNACRTIDAINNPKPAAAGGGGYVPTQQPQYEDTTISGDVLVPFVLLGAWITLDWWLFNWFFTKVMWMVVKICWALTGGLVWDLIKYIFS